MKALRDEIDSMIDTQVVLPIRGIRPYDPVSNIMGLGYNVQLKHPFVDRGGQRQYQRQKAAYKERKIVLVTAHDLRKNTDTLLAKYDKVTKNVDVYLDSLNHYKHGKLLMSRLVKAFEQKPFNNIRFKAGEASLPMTEAYVYDQ